MQPTSWSIAMLHGFIYLHLCLWMCVIFVLHDDSYEHTEVRQKNTICTQKQIHPNGLIFKIPCSQLPYQKKQEVEGECYFAIHTPRCCLPPLWSYLRGMNSTSLVEQCFLHFINLPFLILARKREVADSIWGKTHFN